MKIKFSLKGLFVMAFLLAGHIGMTQITVSGTVTDAQSEETLVGVNIIVVGTTTGTTTDIDGNYSLEVPDESAQLQFSYTGYTTQTIAVGDKRTIDVALRSGAFLDEIVVVGYGTQESGDLTGSVSSVSEDEFQKGNVSTPEQLISGKISGVKINSNSGAPGSGSRIRIRGSSSLNASNDPLIVIDGVPVDNSGIAGSANALNLINPSEIENITVLKDASAAAIYGSRAANGVIMITTKKGESGQDFSIQFSTNNSLSRNPNQVDALTGDEFRQLVQDSGTATQQALLGEANTDWQDEIYRMGFSTQNNLSFMGGLDALPYRLNLEYFQNQGVLKTSQLDRYSVNLNLSPSFFNDQLKLDASGKFSRTNNSFADQGAIGSAVTFDPTKPVEVESDQYGGYYEWLNVNDRPNTLAPRNPVGLLMQRDDISSVNRFLGNLKFDYSPEFLPGFTATVNAGLDISRSSGTVKVDSTAASAYTRKGVDNYYEQDKDNKLFELYGNYKKEFPEALSKIDLTAGYSYQNWSTSSPAQPDINQAGDTIAPAGIDFYTENTLISFYGRLNYTLNGKYLLTATLRNDGSSRFSPDTRWGLFPSAALAWRVSDEPFMDGSKTSIKLRAGYGVTGQQDIGNDYPYIPNYSQGTETAQYQFGNNFYTVLRPDGYDANIKWEETTSYNVGVDLGFLNNRISSTIDYYHKITDDLLAVVPVPAGTNFTNQIFTNVGSMVNKGLEVSLNYIAIDKEDMRLEFSTNVSYNQNEITNLTQTETPDDPGILVGGIPGGVGNTVQIHAVGHSAFSYLVYEQKYDENGDPIEDEYINKVGDDEDEITPGRSDLDLGDQYITERSPEPTVYAGFSTYFDYGNWNFSFTMRGEFGNYIYNAIRAQRGYFNAIDPQSGSYLNNLTTEYFDSRFQDGSVTQFLSDYYLERGDFVRMDNISVGYDFGEIYQDVKLRVNATVQNAFVITGYQGLDPEVVGGIDNNFYPRPRVYSLSLNLNL